ncbi:putative ATP-dependent RNA helicase YTHDC2 [Scophthalmus maximus]|nr:putative ATP-dependent RNA helicase YTHDC2 [Scophthalmus maximus]
MLSNGTVPQTPPTSQSTPPRDDVAEEIKMAVSLCLERFQHSDDQTEMEFPSFFTSTERAYVHLMAQSLGFLSKSRGNGPHRFLSVWKNDGSDRTLTSVLLTVSMNSLYSINGLLQRFPTRPRERVDLQPAIRNGLCGSSQQGDNSGARHRPIGCLNNGIPLVPQKRKPTKLDGFRRSLPAHGSQEEIVQLLRANRVVLVVGETGSGKTTQIPQFLLDDCSASGDACRIFCTQPRRLAVIAVAERVATERGESVGQTVGYHIRLESRFSPRTLLTFCTSEVLLRTLMAGDESLETVTHVIVDEVHERDGLTDILLIKMRSVLRKIPMLKLILCSAALDMDLFQQYFGSCPVIQLKGRPFEVQEVFLEDVLKLTGFNNKDRRTYQGSTQRKEQTSSTNMWCKAAENKQRSPESMTSFLQDNRPLDRGDGPHIHLKERDSEHLEPWLVKEMDSCIFNIFFSEDPDAYSQLFNLILYENVNVDYTHTEIGATPLMMAASRGFSALMEQLLIMGADVNVKASNGWTALDFAEHFQHADAMDLLRSSIPLTERSSFDYSPEEHELLRRHHHSSDDEWTDLDLVMDLLHHICSTTCDGAVLIFLPGYEEMVTLKYRILFDDKRFSGHVERFNIFTLHSDTQTLEQKKVLSASQPGVRKIILSTDIAETSITVNDVVFVIDSGKVKEKSFDTLSCVSTLKTVWISKASALQRKGRAGRSRTGICFHLFSRLSFNNMLEFHVPQLLRMSLQEMCLQTKLLAPSCPVSDFLSRAPQPPPAQAIRDAVQRLKMIGAMNRDEDLTDLGYHLAELSVEPHLGKMVLCAVVLKCLDPILTIACTLAYRDPFVLPARGSQKRVALHCRKHFSSCSFSDHMALLRAFQAWQKSRYEGCERSFCEKNFLSQSTMEMILGMRIQLLAQLRAIGFVRARGGCDIHELNLNSENWAVVKAALVAGMYPNMFHVDREASELSNDAEKKIHFHPTSILNQFKEKSSSRSAQAPPTDWFVYDEMRRGKQMASVRCCSLVTPIAVAIFGGCAMLPSSALQEHVVPRATGSSSSDSPPDDSDSGSEDVAEVRVDDWLAFQLEPEAAGLVSKLKKMWLNLLVWRSRNPSKCYNQKDEAVLQTLVSVLTEEEQQAGLQQPTGIGQRPRPMMPGEWPQQSPVKGLKNSPQQPASPAPTPDNFVSFVTRSSVRSCESSVPTDQLSDDLWSSCSVTSDSPSHSTSPPNPVKLQVSKPLSDGQPLRYFVMQSSNIRNIEISKQSGIWSTTTGNKTKLTEAFLSNCHVVLVFTAQYSGCFQGYACMVSDISREISQDWDFTGLEKVYGVEWIHRESLPFECTQHILNPWSDNEAVQMSSDGQELEPQAGRQLLLLWER